MFKVCGIIGISEIGFFNFSGTERVKELSSGKSQLLRILFFLDFNHACNIIVSKNEKSLLKCKYTNNKKLSDLIPGYEVNPATT